MFAIVVSVVTCLVFVVVFPVFGAAVVVAPAICEPISAIVFVYTSIENLILLCGPTFLDCKT